MVEDRFYSFARAEINGRGRIVRSGVMGEVVASFPLFFPRSLSHHLTGQTEERIKERERERN